jgi:hypothetical protein
MTCRTPLIVILIARAVAVAAQQLPLTTDDVVILAKESFAASGDSTLTLGRDTRLVSGQLVVNDPGGVLRVRGFFRALPGTQVIGDTVQAVTARSAAPEFSDVFANTFDSGAGTVIDGVGPLPVGLPLFGFPTVALVTPGTDACPKPGRIAGDCVVHQSDGPITLQPGNYRKIILRQRAELYFAGGTYNVKSIRGASGAHFLFNAATTLNVAETAAFGFRSVVGPAFADQPNGRCIVINVAGDQVRLRPWADVAAVINAPEADAALGRWSVYRGNLAAKTVKVRVGVLLGALPHLPTCP